MLWKSLQNISFVSQNEELGKISSILEEKLSQIPTPHSIIFQGNRVWKLVTNVLEEKNLMRFVNKIMKTGSPEYTADVPSIEYKFEGCNFFCYDNYLPPLSCGQVSQCLKEFVCSVAKASNELHVKFDIAHLDVQIPNIMLC